ncbi:fibronectin type III domain-containing protein 7 [Alosa sapidissima]|uniref:fibronectin type III domain-containing protein 7 n=1 Tax=Alosa sapidissima TaxID=34773 RepID=UPI001C097206|nr:fibronectin type III domain-containing protein 7 [Alosa sapidissima]
MGPKYLRLLKYMLLSIGLCKICAAQNDITVSVFTVTSKSMTVRWTGHSGASSYKVTATPKNSPDTPVFKQFSGNTVMGSVNSLMPNTVYTMRVDAMDSVNVLSSAVTEEITAPEVPTIHQAYSKQSDSITVEFGEVSGASSYILRAQTLDGEFFSETEVNKSNRTVINLQPYTVYSLNVMSVNTGGRSQPSLPVLTRTVVESPALNTTSPSNDTIHVSWEPVEHAVLYSLCIIMEGSETRVKLNTTDTAHTFTDLEPGTTYCIKGTAWDSDGNMGEDRTICQITRPTSPLEVAVSLTPGRTLGMAVSWSEVRGADVYLANTSTYQNCSSNVENYCLITSLYCGQNLSVTVTAHNQAGPSSPSQPEEFITFPCPPESVWVEEAEAGMCSVMWGDVDFADFYIAYVKRDDGSEERCNTTDTVCHFRCLCGFTFFPTVFAYNQAGPSLPGPVLNYTTIPCCPEDVTVSLVSTETLDITWSAVRGAELYETIAADQRDVIHCNDTAPVCALSDLSCNSRYSVVVRPCSEIRGCNNTCRAHTQETAPCAPEILNITQTSESGVLVQWSAANTEANYTVSAVGRTDSFSCHSTGTACEITGLPCGATYELSAYARTTAGRSLPSYSHTLETEPCCPKSLTVEQVTQAMTQVSWSAATGARSYVTSLTSPKGQAKCHTMDMHCTMGCITCGTNYTVTLEAISKTGHKRECSYLGFSSSACCPSSVKLYRMANNTLRVYWRSSDSLHNHLADLYGTSSNYTCTPPMGSNYCDVSEIVCGEVYTVVVAPLAQDGTKITFCPRRMYSVSCSGNTLGMVIYRGKRSVD